MLRHYRDSLGADGASRRLLPLVIVLSLAGLAVVAPSGAAASLSGHPGPIAVDAHGDAWVAESGSHGVVEINPATGDVLRTVSGPSYRFDDPAAIAVIDANVWVASVGFMGARGNASAARLTEFSSTTGRLIRILDLKTHKIQGLSELWASGSTLWLSASGGSVIAAIDTRSGRLLHAYFHGPVLGGSQPTGLVVSHGRVVYVDQGYVRIVVRDIATGRITRTFSPRILARAPGMTQKVHFYVGPRLVAVTPTDIWAICGSSRHLLTGSVLEINRRTGHVVRTIDATSNDFYSPNDVATRGSNLYILDGPVWMRQGMRGAALTIIDETTGATRRVVSFLQMDGRFSDPTGLALSGNRAIVSDSGVNKVIILNATTGQVERTL